MKKTFNVVMLPTEKASHIFLRKDSQKLDWSTISTDKVHPNHENQHLYFISNDKIKEGDWYYDTNHNAIGKYDSSAQIGKKIVATTDKSIMHLSNNGRVGYPLPNIPESFIQDYIKAYNEGEPITAIVHDR